MDRAEMVGLVFVVVGVVLLAMAAGIWFGRAATFAVIGVSSVVAGVVTVRAAAVRGDS